jgi:hypothetical protein
LLTLSSSQFDPSRTSASRTGGNYAMFRPSALGTAQ